MVAGGLMMKSDRQLNHALDVKPKMAPQRLVARDGAPGVLENFMGVIEMGVVEESDAVVEISAHSRDVHRRLTRLLAPLSLTIFIFIDYPITSPEKWRLSG
jgi:hypothetical protein